MVIRYTIMSTPTSAPAVQEKIEIEDIKDNIVFLKDGGLRAILMTTAINFSLKSTDEQSAAVFQYQAFLNSLDFPVQILVTSRRLDIAPYLTALEQKQKEQENELLRIQISEYIDFIKNLTQANNIMNQTFYVIVPLSRTEKKEAGLLEKLGLFQKATTAEQQKSVEELKTQLWQRVDYVIAGLASFGIKAAPLNTQEATDLFYHLYNMEAKEKAVAQNF